MINYLGSIFNWPSNSRDKRSRGNNADEDLKEKELKYLRSEIAKRDAIISKQNTTISKQNTIIYATSVDKLFHEGLTNIDIVSSSSTISTLESSHEAATVVLSEFGIIPKLDDLIKSVQPPTSILLARLQGSSKYTYNNEAAIARLVDDFLLDIIQLCK